MQRYLIVTCIIAALIMAAFKPARGAPPAPEPCAAAVSEAANSWGLAGARK